MARRIDPRNSDWVVGPIRVVARGNHYRVLWTEGGKQRERTAGRFEDAKAIAVKEMNRLELDGPHAGQRVPFGALIQDVIEAGKGRWAPDWIGFHERMARLHVLPELGAVWHDQITVKRLQNFLDGLQKTGGEPYSYSYVNHCRRLVARAVSRGVELGLYEPHSHPARGLVTRTAATDHDDGSPNLEAIPTDDQVQQLIKLLADLRPMYGVMAKVAAYTGVRWGELMGLTRYDYDPERRVLTVRRNCQESRDGYRFRKVSKHKGGPKPREIIADEVADVLEEWIEGLDGEPPVGHRIIGAVPDGRLFYAKTGNPIANTNNSFRMRKIVQEIPGWPEGASWHTLRHYAITRWLNMGFEPRFTSQMAGHGRNPVTTWNWYLGVDSGAIERHQKLLRGEEGE